MGTNTQLHNISSYYNYHVGYLPPPFQWKTIIISFSHEQDNSEDQKPIVFVILFIKHNSHISTMVTTD